MRDLAGPWSVNRTERILRPRVHLLNFSAGTIGWRGWMTVLYTNNREILKALKGRLVNFQIL